MSNGAPQPDELGESFEPAFAHLQVRVETACASETEWAAGVAAGIRAALTYAAAVPAAAEILTNEAMAGGKEGFARYDRMIEYFATALEPGRAQRPEGEQLPRITEKTMIGGVAMLVAQRLSSGQHHDLPELAPEAIQFVLTPYLGAAEARRIAFGDPA